eukprot:jgi/Ulvmu1/12163/UM085_0027.1
MGRATSSQCNCKWRFVLGALQIQCIDRYSGEKEMSATGTLSSACEAPRSRAKCNPLEPHGVQHAHIALKCLELSQFQRVAYTDGLSTRFGLSCQSTTALNPWAAQS